MRRIDWSKPLSDQDVAWLQTAGILGIEARIAANLAEHGIVESSASEEPFEDNYDDWKVAELEAELANRGDISPVEVVGTGSGGNVTKPDLVKALRLWDQDNPDTES